jgi:hypothetical protein
MRTVLEYLDELGKLRTWEGDLPLLFEGTLFSAPGCTGHVVEARVVIPEEGKPYQKVLAK